MSDSRPDLIPSCCKACADVQVQDATGTDGVIAFWAQHGTVSAGFASGAEVLAWLEQRHHERSETSGDPATVEIDGVPSA